MTLSRIDWVVTWKLHHVQFFWIHLALGIPLRFVAARSFRASTSKTTSSVIVASFVSSVSCTWLPIVPVIMLCAVRSRWGKSRWPVASDQCASSRRYNGYLNRVSRCNAVPYVIETTCEEAIRVLAYCEHLERVNCASPYFGVGISSPDDFPCRCGSSALSVA
jgi:hypothetical protein